MNKDFDELVRHLMGMRNKPDNLPITTQKRRGTREHLARILGDLRYNRGAEIGVRAGVYSECLCKANPDIELYCVDTWQNPDPEKQHRTERYLRQAKERLGGFNATLVRKASMDALADFEDESLDFVYIDADHTFDHVCPDIIFWSQKVRQGGIVAGHDYYHFKWSGVMAAVDAYTRCHDIRPWYVTHEITPSWFWEKP